MEKGGSWFQYQSGKKGSLHELNCWGNGEERKISCTTCMGNKKGDQNMSGILGKRENGGGREKRTVIHKPKNNPNTPPTPQHTPPQKMEW